MSRPGSNDRWTALAVALVAGVVIGACGWRIATALRTADTGAHANANGVAARASGGGGNGVASNGATGDGANPTLFRGANPTANAGGNSLAGPTPLLKLPARPVIDPGRTTAQLAEQRAERATAAAAQPQPVVPEADARVALDYVGADGVAEQIWETAINDPALSPDRRSNLIEDLNENGFRDPDHIQPDELPLVLSRLDLIEQLAPQAMDQTNAAAFDEAYKDLTNIANRLQPQADAGQMPQ